MKKFILILATTLGLSANAQTKRELIWQYANDHLGERIGDGNCDELIIYAYKAVCGCNARRKDGIGKYRYFFGTEIPRDSVQKGDIINISRYDSSGKELHGHVGIVYSVAGDKMEVVHQNNGYTKRKDSFLLIANYDEVVIPREGITEVVTYYRPN